MKCSDYKPNQIQTYCGNVFQRLKGIWDETKKNDPSCNPDRDGACWRTDIWRKANTLQTVAYLWQRYDDPSMQAMAMQMMTDAHTFYADYIKKHDVWVDDFGWWAGFFVDLYRYTKKSPLPGPFTPNQLLAYTEECYNKMLINFDDKKRKPPYELGEGGIWNNKGFDKSKNPTGEKNTVTNAWMLNVASDLFNWTKEAKYKTMADEQYTWLTTGGFRGQAPKTWVLYNDQNGLLWWLPGLKDTNGSQYWSGDEGVFLRGIHAYIDVNPTKKDEILKNSKKLVIDAITPTEDFKDGPYKGFPDKENVMHESPVTDGSNDLATGKGVFMRLVTRVVHDWKYFGDAKLKTQFQAFVNSTAESVWCSCAEHHTTASNWNPGFGDEGTTYNAAGLWPQVYQTNGLDALNAAWEIS